jgi:hypothetical protein
MVVLVLVVGRAPGRGPGRWPGLLVVAGVLLVPDDRLLAGVVIAASGHRLMAPLVGGRPVAGLPGPVPRLTVGGVLALTVPRPLVLSGIAALALAASVRPVHFRHPFAAARQPCLGTPRAICWQWVLALPRSPPHSHVGGRALCAIGAAASALRCLHRDQVRRARRHPGGRRSWRLHRRRRRLPVRYLVGVGVGIAGLVVLPYAEELLRCARRAR